MVTGVVADVSGLGLVDSKVPGGGGGVCQGRRVSAYMARCG